MQCYAQTDVPSKCTAQADDYLECLHHTKEVRRSVYSLSFCSHSSPPFLPHDATIPYTTPLRLWSHLASLVIQIERAKTVKKEFIRKAEHQAHDRRKAAEILADGVIVGVGLIQRGEAAHSK